MAKNDTQDFVERYLYRARNFRAREESVLAQGAREGHSERALRRAARNLGLIIDQGIWELAPGHARSLTQIELFELDRVGAEPGAPVRQPVRR